MPGVNAPVYGIARDPLSSDDEGGPVYEDKNVKMAEAVCRRGFIRKVYVLLAVQLLVTVAIAAPLQSRNPLWIDQHRWMVYSSMAVMLVMVCCASMNAQLMREFPYNYGVLSVVTVCMGMICGFVSAMYTWQSVVLSLGITAFVFVGMTAYAWCTKTDFTGLGPYLFGFLMVLCGFSFVLLILSFCGIHVKWLTMVFDILGVMLFTFYIIFDTQMIMGGDHQVKFTLDDYAFATLQLYLDVINLFLHLLALFGDRK